MSQLFHPLKLRGVTLKNRIVVSPMQQYSSEDGFASDWHLVHLGSRAVGGAGLIVSECAAVNQDGRCTTSDLGMWKDEHIDKWQQINEFIHQQGVKTAIQLGHFGSKGSRAHPNDGFGYISPDEGGWQTLSSSPVAPFSGMSTPRELNTTEIKSIIEDFACAARRSVEAGFDIIELHFAHGYLVHQFLSKLVNSRKDEYGGSFENRIRFAVEITKSVRKVMPENMPLFVKLSAVDYSTDKDAWSIQDSIELSKALKQEGIDLITASAGGFGGVDKAILKEGYQVEFAEKIREDADIFTGAVGLISTPQYANKIVEDGSCDLVVIAREHLRNPYFSVLAAKRLGFEAGVPWQYKRAF